MIANCETQLGLIRTLRGLTPTFGCFDDEKYSEAKAESHYASNPALILSECFYWTRKLQARFFAGDYSEAIECARRALPMLWTAASQVETGDFDSTQPWPVRRLEPLQRKAAAFRMPS